MAKLTEKNILDYRIGGDTLNDFALKYMAEIPRIYQFLNNIRTHDSVGTEQIEPEPYQIKVEDDKFYVRNKTNDAWLYLFDAGAAEPARKTEKLNILRNTPAQV